MQMEFLSGVVSKVRHSTEVSGTKETTTSSYVAIFQLGNTPVSLSVPGPVIIDEGNTVSIAGRRRRGIFHARAYKNETLNVWGSKAGWSQVLFGIPFIPLAGIGIYVIWDAMQNLKARQKIGL
ncbi:hypothetical protein [Leisingera sp. ANG-S5]|uniref:hypothetical protein n=1 Tax=Leisingera sp. ANG-S5 TaxID=1577901 RepID=UPI001269F11A|nr:hypothetical protein [Leisingera sp. ANG-S5]